jgi:hypothetical protein
MDVNNLLSKLDKVKSTGNGKYLACCPAHPDRSPSLAIKQTDDEKLLLHCFSGCSVVDILAAIGLELSDLMPENPSYQKGNKPPRFNKYELFDRLMHESIILSLAVRQLLNFQDLSAEDMARVSIAENVINSIAMEIRR